MIMANNNGPSAKEVYDLVDSRTENVRRELGTKIDVVTKSVADLASAFNAFEAGRVSALERRIAIMEVANSQSAVNKANWQNWTIPAILYIFGQIMLLIFLKKVP